MIRGRIELFDEHLKPPITEEIPLDLENPTDNPHFSIGSKLRAITFAKLEQSGTLFARFHILLSKFISELLLASGISLPGGQYVKYTVDDMVSSQFHHVSIDYLIGLLNPRSRRTNT